MRAGVVDDTNHKRMVEWTDKEQRTLESAKACTKELRVRASHLRKELQRTREEASAAKTKETRVALRSRYVVNLKNMELPPGISVTPMYDVEAVDVTQIVWKVAWKTEGGEETEFIMDMTSSGYPFKCPVIENEAHGNVKFHETLDKLMEQWSPAITPANLVVMLHAASNTD